MVDNAIIIISTMSLTSIEYVNILFFICMSMGSIISNLILIIAIVFGTPRNLRNYGILLGNSVAVDLIGAISALMIIPRQVPGDIGVLMIMYGHCKRIDRRLCYFFFGTMDFALTQSFYLMCSTFAYRLLVLCGWKSTLIIIVPFLLILNPLIYVIVGRKIFAVLDHFTTRTRAEIAQDLAYFDFGTARAGFVFWYVLFAPRSVYDTRGDWTANGCMCFVLVSGPVVFGVTYVLRRRIIIVMEAGKEHMSKATLVMHQMLYEALRAQLYISTLLLLAASVFTLNFLNIYRAEILDFAPLAITNLITVVAPASNIYYVRPYKLFIKHRLIRMGRRTIHPIGTDQPSNSSQFPSNYYLNN